MTELEKQATLARHAADMGDHRLAYFTLARAVQEYLEKKK
jgi:hypothetical protein